MLWRLFFEKNIILIPPFYLKTLFFRNNSESLVPEFFGEQSEDYQKKSSTFGTEGPQRDETVQRPFKNGHFFKKD